MPPSIPAQYPLINGVRFDFSSVELNLSGKFFNGIKSINYEDSLEPGKVRGNRSQVIGRTRGEYNASGSLELYALEYEELTDILQLISAGRGIYEVSFPIVVSYAEIGQRVIVDSLFGCRITKAAVQAQEGSDAITKQLDLDIMRISHGGKDPLGVRQMLK